VFVCPLSDFLLEEADPWRGELWAQIRERSDVDFYIQTKRVIRLLEPGILPSDWSDGYPNVYINATVDDPSSSEERLLALVEVPARHRVIAMCPTTTPLNLIPGLKTKKIQQGYLIGEIGCGMDWTQLLKTTRPLRYEWVKDISEQFRTWTTHFDFKGSGTIWIDKNGKKKISTTLIDQFNIAQDCDLGVTGDSSDYTIAWGANHTEFITDWTDGQSTVLHGPRLSRVFY